MAARTRVSSMAASPRFECRISCRQASGKSGRRQLRKDSCTPRQPGRQWQKPHASKGFSQ